MVALAAAAELRRLRQVIDLVEVRFAMVAADFAETEPGNWGGYVSPIQAMRQQCGMTGSAAATAICVGSQAPSIPTSVAALQDGRLGFDHLAVLASTTRTLRESSISGEVDEQPLLDQALAHGLQRFRHDCAHVRHAHDSAAYLAEQREQMSYRYLELHGGEGGTLFLKGFFDPEAAAAIRTALDPLARWSGAGDLRGRWQRYGDALRELSTHGLDTGHLPNVGGQRPHLHVTTTVETLQGLPGAPAGMLEHAGPIAAATVQRLACDASVARVVMGPDSVVTDVGRAHRLPSAPTRRALLVRDAGCVWAGCDRPASWTSARHLEHWGHGGATSLDNLIHRKYDPSGHGWTSVPRKDLLRPKLLPGIRPLQRQRMHLIASRPGCLREVEVADEVAQDRLILTNVRTRVRPSVAAGVDALAAQEVVLDELVVRVEAQRLMIDVPLPGVGADYDPGTRSPYPFTSTAGGTTWS